MKYNPTVYSGKLLVKFYEATVLAAIANTDYEGEIKQQGDTVIIRSTPTITIRPYKNGQVLQNEQPVSAPVTLLIDKGNYWSFVSKKLDDKQTDIKNYVENWTQDASEGMKIAVDTDVLGTFYADASAYNKGATAGYRTAGFNLGTSGSPVSITKSDVLDYIVDCGTVLDEMNIPETGRWMIIPAWMAGLIKKSDLKDASLSGDGTSVIRNGRLGMIDRFTLYKSNLLPTASDGGTCFYMPFGTKHALTFASQLVDSEDLPNPFGFGRLHRGLQVYGYEVIKPEALGVLYGKKG
jgi:hypothetical protein